MITLSGRNINNSQSNREMDTLNVDNKQNVLIHFHVFMSTHSHFLGVKENEHRLIKLIVDKTTNK